MPDFEHILIPEEPIKQQILQTNSLIPSSTTLQLETPKENEQIHISTLKIYIRCLLIAFGGIFTGYNFCVLNLAQPKLNHVYQITDNIELYEGLLSSLLLLGQMIGSILCGSIIQKLGERKTCILCDVFGILLTLLFVIPDIYVALVARILIGIVGGINDPTVVMYIKAISPKSLSGKTGSFFMLCVTSGMLISCLSGLGFPIAIEDLQSEDHFYWRFHYLLPILFLSIRLFSLKFIYKLDTPLQYLKESKADETMKALREIYKESKVLFQFESLKEEFGLQVQQQSDTWSNVFSAKNSSKQKLASYLQFAYNFSGMIAILLFSSIIFEQFTGSALISQYLTVGLMFFQILSSFLSGELSKKFGRKSILVFGMVVNIILLLTFGTSTLMTKSQIEKGEASQFTVFWTLSIIFLFCSIFRMTSGTLTWSYVAEITSAKGNVLSVSLNFFLSFVLGLVFPSLQKSLGLHTMLYFFAGTQIFFLFFLYPKIKETKGLSQSQIDSLFEQQKPLLKKEPVKITIQLSHLQHSPKDTKSQTSSFPSTGSIATACDSKQKDFDMLHNNNMCLDQQHIVIEIKSDQESEQFVPLVAEKLANYQIVNYQPCVKEQG